MDRGGHKNRISWEQRQELVKIYLKDGLDAAQKVATKLGLAKNYVQRLLWTLGITSILIFVQPIHARDLAGQFSNSPLKSWFDHLSSGKGPCCSDADGVALSDIDWKSKDGHYSVFIEDRWWDVPDEAVIKEPNRSGRTMVWPIYTRNIDASLLSISIRCFMPGSMT